MNGDTDGEVRGARRCWTAYGVDELAERTGMTVRNIRAHQSRRLLHPPRRSGRRSVYDESHVERLQLIQRLQDAGFTLAAVRALVHAGSEASEVALAWRAEAVAMRFLPGDGIPAGKLAIEKEGMEALLALPGALEALESFGLVRRVPGGGWQGTHPVLVSAGRRARESGMPSPKVTGVQLMIAEHTATIAESLVRSFEEHVTGVAGTPPGDAVVTEQLRDAYEVLSPLVTAIVTATFEVQLARTLRARFGLDIDDQGRTAGG
jgi:DNA-binding transcriptional MerR regulator